MSLKTDRQEIEDHGDQLAANIVETALVRLKLSGYHALNGLTCSFDDGVLTLDGRVGTFHHKQLAQTVVHGIPGVGRIDNNVVVSGA